MTTVLEENVHNFAVEGSSDDLDVPIKEDSGEVVFPPTRSFGEHGITFRELLTES